MKEKDRLYWEGIAKAQAEPLPKPKSVKAALDFLDDAIEFIKTVKGKITYEEPTEIELYKKWLALKRS